MPTAASIGTSLLGFIGTRNASRRAADSAEQGQERAIEAMQQATREARRDVIPLFDSAQQNALLGLGGTLDMLNEIAPLQQEAAVGGNFAAQNQIAAAVPQSIAAILGGAINLGALAPTKATLPRVQFQMPEFTSIADSLGAAGRVSVNPLTGQIAGFDQTGFFPTDGQPRVGGHNSGGIVGRDALNFQNRNLFNIR